MSAAVRPRVSVIVPLYNKSPYVLRSLQSIAAQSFAAFEAIVIDDGSTDDGPSKVRDFAASDLRFRLVQQPNAGPGAARNRGIAEARGEFCAFLDGDDEWLPAHLEDGVSALDRSPEAAAASTSVNYLPGPGSHEPMWRRRGLETGLFRATAATPVPLMISAVAFMHPCSTVARTPIVREQRGFFEKRCLYAEDAHLWLRVLLRYPAWFSLPPRVNIWRDAAALSGNLRGVRPVEPFLREPETVTADCPAAMRQLLAGFLAARAFKTATLYALSGQWREAARLRDQFRVPGDWKLPFYWPSALVSNSAGGRLASTLWRCLGSMDRPRTAKVP